jgi:hypothetical protein
MIRYRAQIRYSVGSDRQVAGGLPRPLWIHLQAQTFKVIESKFPFVVQAAAVRDSCISVGSDHRAVHTILPMYSRPPQMPENAALEASSYLPFSLSSIHGPHRGKPSSPHWAHLCFVFVRILQSSSIILQKAMTREAQQTQGI